MTVDRVRYLFSYDRNTGIFRRRQCAGKWPAGGIVGHSHPTGYIQILIDGRLFGAHRVAWFYIYGDWPPENIDHINGNKADNRIANLRLASTSENSRNRGPSRTNKTGLKGVRRWRNRYSATIGHLRKIIHLGTFDTAYEAHAAYCAAARELHGEFARFE